MGVVVHLELRHEAYFILKCTYASAAGDLEDQDENKVSLFAHPTRPMDESIILGTS